MLESLALQVGVIELRVAGGDLLPVDDELVDIDGRGIGIVEARQGNKLLGDVGDEAGIDRLLLHKLLEDMLGHLELLGAVGDVELQLGAAPDLPLLVEGEPSGNSLLDEIMVGGALPGAGEIDGAGDVPLRVAVMNLMVGIAEHHGEMADHLLDQHRHHPEVGVGPVGLEHGEFGIMTAGYPLVAEAAVELEDFREAGDEKALEVEFRRDAEIEVHAQRVVMGLERLGGGAPRDRLHHRGLHLEKAALVEEPADLAHDETALAEGLARRGVGDQVKVALAVAGLGVLHPVPLVGKGAQRLGEHHQTGHLDARFAGPGRETLTLHTDEVPDVELGSEGKRRLVEFLAVEIDLHASADVGEVEEAALPHVAVGGDAPGHGDAFPLGKRGPDFIHRAGGVEGAPVGIDSEITDGLKFLPADGYKIAER